jgi:signal transduction histidine kinase/CheY-like chemotaxis protein
VAGRLIFIVNIPVWRDGKVAYVLNAAFAPDEMSRLLHESPQFRNVPAVIFDRNGFIVGRWQNADKFVGKRIAQHQLERLKNRDEGIGVGETLEGVQLYYSYARSPATGWGVSIGVERGAIEKEIQTNWIIAAALALGGLALGVLMAFLLASRLRRSIADLAEAAARSEPPRLSGLRTRELAQLERALNDAAAIREAQAQERESRLVAEARKAEAEEASRTKDHFIAVLSHELRNPLAPVRSAVHLLRELNKDRSDVRMNEIIDMLDRQSRQLTRLVSDLLDVSRISSGKIVLKRERVDLCAVARHAAESAMPGVEGRNHRLSCDMPQKPVKVMGDFARLSQVVSNLLDNAVKYTPRGGDIRLSVRVEAGLAVLSVEDSGCGIEPAMQPMLFSGLVRSPERDGQEQGGLGLGLPLSRSLVELHGGTLEAYSEGKDKGTRFTMRIPLADEPQPEAGDGITSDASVAPRSDERQRVLIVDDNVDAAVMLDRLLRALGHETLVANDGAAALTVARDFRPEVALIDIGMPGMDGYEVARHLRAMPANGSLRIVAVTGWGQESDRAKSKAAGFDMHLVKPVDAEQLAQAVAGRGMPFGSSR